MTGYAKGNSALAEQRARAIASFVSARVKVHVTIKTVTSTSLSMVTVATTKE